MRRAAIVGVDGCGKSTLVHRLRERFPPLSSGVAAINCPRYDETPDAPFAELSVQLKALSDVADELRSFELKLAALYLRMTLYGPVERHFADALAPAHLVSDRHPLVDTLTYVPLYARRAAGVLDRDAIEPQVRERLVPGALDAAMDWHALECRRRGVDTGFWALAQDILAAFARGPDAVVADFGERYRTTLPDVVVWLDVPPEEAAARAGGRAAGGRELHEDLRALAALSATYEQVVQELPERRPGIEVHRLVSSGRGVDETLDELVAVLGLPG